MKNEDPSGYRLIRLAHGVWSVRSIAHDETFHPVIGPAAEAERLYVGQLHLAERAAATHREFVVWDVGLGAAANAIAVLRAMRDSRGSLRIVSFDHTLEPLHFALQHADVLGYLSGYEIHAQRLLEKKTTRFHAGEREVCWQMQQADFPSHIAQCHARKLADCHGRSESASDLPAPDAILYDAYSPAKNPAMWTRSLFQQLYQLLDPRRPCALATYSRSTLIRATLLVAGFHVGVGPATGEKEETTVAANDRRLIVEPLTRSWLSRARRSTSGEPLRGPVYRQTPLSQETWEQLLEHPQFR